MSGRWMIYGANGYTGDLVARLAAARGEAPTLAGRNGPAVRALAGELGLPYAILDLSDPAPVRAALRDIDLVAHLAGPYVRTAAPMLAACLATGTACLDITGEPSVLADVLDRDAAARAAGVPLLTGAGFDVVPTDCLAALVTTALPDASGLEIAFHAPGGMSRGTMHSGAGFLGEGARRRVAGELVPARFGAAAREFPFPSGPRVAGVLTWGDLITAQRSTGVGDITVYSTAARPNPVAPVLHGLLRFPPVRAVADRWIRRRPAGPSPQTRARTRVEVWAEARNAAGERRSATLSGPNAYDLTADTVLRAARRLLSGSVPAGAHTPATAFGPGFLDDLDGVEVHGPAA